MVWISARYLSSKKLCCFGVTRCQRSGTWATENTTSGKSRGYSAYRVTKSQAITYSPSTFRQLYVERSKMAIKCEICNQKIAQTFLGKLLGTYIKDAKGKKHTICKNCQQQFGSKKAILEK